MSAGANSDSATGAPPAQQQQQQQTHAETVASQPHGDIDSGVSNGDVDWLFRGKASKKLAKKKPEVNNLNLNFSKQQFQQPAQQPMSPDSKLTQQLKQAAPGQQQQQPPSTTAAAAAGATAAPKQPLKPAIVNSGELHNRSRASSDSARTLGSRPRSSSETKSHLSSSSPHTVHRRSSEVGITPSLTPSSSSGSTQSGSVPISGKKNLFSSISSKFAKPAQPGTSPAAIASPALSASEGTVPSPSLNISAAKKSPVLSVTPPEQKGLFGLRRRISVSKGAAQPPPVQPASPAPPQSVARRDTPLSPARDHGANAKTKDKALLDGSRLKRVTFALDKLMDDPQQQIPSRNPKRGNVLVPEDLLAEPARLSIGIADGSNTISSAKKQASVDKEELRIAYEAQKEALLESQKHAHEAHLAAQRMAKEVSTFRISRNALRGREDATEEDEENFVHSTANLHNIDNPLHQHIDYFGDSTDEVPLANNEKEAETKKEIPLETIYTRCCHLREILPIPATLKQLKGKSKPLTVLKMLNPKPTLIDILSFSDFLAITPIVTIIFDNVTIDTEMLKIVLSSISNSTHLEKLSLRNVAIGPEGWAYLCKFLTLSKSLIKLDISQQKIKADTPKSMHRCEMDWNLFTESLVKRGGLEELVINGCKLSDSQFEHMISHGVSISTKRLGVAATNLNVAKCEVLAKWITRPGSTCIGIDIAFNDMSNGQLKPFIDSFNESTNLAFFSLNSTNVTVQDCEAMIKTLSTLKNLRFLDLSNIPHCFPDVISTLSEWLPKFPDLKRLHFELDELTAPELVAIANILPNCKTLIHISFLGHKDINYATAVAFYGAIKMSSVYTLDIDYDLIPEDLSSKIALYLMINMEKSMNKDLHFEYERSDEELMFDGSLITQAAENLLESKTPTQSSFQKKSEQLYSKEVITKALMEKTSRVRHDIHKQMDKLFDLRIRGQLSLEGKETLIRFCLLDNSLEKVVNIFEEEENSKSQEVVAHDPSAQDEHLHKVSSDILETGPIVSPNLPANAHQSSYFSALQPQQPLAPTEHPHLVVTDSNKEGEDVPIDKSTGRPVLFRKLSHTSEHAKQQEEEEGEFHKWGFFIQNSLFPDGAKKTTESNNMNHEAQISAQQAASPQLRPLQVTSNSINSSASHTPVSKRLNVLPSGAELREVILRAKGSQKLNDLVEKFNYDHNKDIKIEDLYNTLVIDKDLQNHLKIPSSIASLEQQQHQTDDFPDLDKVLETGSSAATKSLSHNSPLTMNDSDSLEPGSPRSINSFELDEVYEQLLNEVDKVRSHNPKN